VRAGVGGGIFSGASDQSCFPKARGKVQRGENVEKTRKCGT